MDQNNQNKSSPVPQDSAERGRVQTDSVTFGNIPHDAATFGKIPHDSESFRNVPQASERKENHTLTVREVARLFEAAGVARSERSIVNWCQPNRQGIPRLDSYYDPNERKYFITSQSVEAAITEEKARAAAKTPQAPESSEPVHTIPTDTETAQTSPESGDGRIKELEKENLDLKITNRGKDFFIEQLQKEREGLIQQVVGFSHQVGQLETELRQLSAPRKASESGDSPSRHG